MHVTRWDRDIMPTSDHCTASQALQRHRQLAQEALTENREGPQHARMPCTMCVISRVGDNVTQRSQTVYRFGRPGTNRGVLSR